jgi:hypothetical protein
VLVASWFGAVFLAAMRLLYMCRNMKSTVVELMAKIFIVAEFKAKKTARRRLDEVSGDYQADRFCLGWPPS